MQAQGQVAGIGAGGRHRWRLRLWFWCCGAPVQWRVTCCMGPRAVNMGALLSRVRIPDRAITVGDRSRPERTARNTWGRGGGVGDRPVSWWVKWLSAAAGEGQWGVKCWQVIRGGVRVVVVRHLHRQHPRTLRRLVVGW